MNVMETHESNGNENALAPRTTEMVRRDLMGTSITRQSGAIEAMVAKERAMIEARWTMALHKPRNLDQVRTDVLKECARPGFADAAVYERPVGSKYNERTQKWEDQFIEGLSIRFAEVAVRCMKNISVETQTVHDADTERRVRVTVTDLEGNGTWSRDLTIAKTVERKRLKKGQKPINTRVNSYGDTIFTVEATDDEVSVKEAAAVSKAARTLILRLVPGHIQDEALAKCKQVCSAADAQDPDAARNKVFDAFAGIGVKPVDLEKFLGHTTDTLSPGELERLRKVYAAISTDEMSWQDALDAAESSRAEKPADAKPEQTTQSSKSGKGTSAVKDQLKKQKTDAPPPAQPAQPVQPAAPAQSAQPPATSTQRDGYEDRTCSQCGVPIEVPKADPPGAKCYACSQS